MISDKKYEDYQLQDFIADQSFEEWVNHPTRESNLFWEKWLETHPHQKETIKNAQLVLKSLKFKDKNIIDNPNKVLNRIQQSIQENRAYTIKSLPTRTIYPWRAMVAAASVLLLISVFWLLFRSQEKIQNYQTEFGQTQEITLPDGSIVVLNVNSQLHFSENWDEDKAREVFLEGEAFFKVQKTPERKNPKFIVHTPDLDVEVLGTQFNVNTRREQTQVVLKSGKVNVKEHNHNKSIKMESGEILTYHKKEDTYEKKTVKTDLYTSWKDNQLIFEGNSLKEIAQILEDNYGYQVIIEDKILEEEKFVGTFPADKIHILISTLEVDFAVVQEGKKIIIKQKNNLPKFLDAPKKLGQANKHL